VGLCQLVLAQTRLEVGSDRHQWAHSASCAMVMVWISASWQYTLSTSSAVGAGEAFKGSAAVASVKPPSRLAEEATPFPRAWVEAKSTIRILSSSSAGSCHGRS
jgi:hypothetical protein